VISYGFSFSFPFPIICTENCVRWPTIERRVGGSNVTIYPPFLSGKNCRLTQDIDLARSPAFDRKRIIVAPSQRPVGGFRTIPDCFSEPGRAKEKQVETNSIQISVDCGSENKSEKIAKAIMKSGLRELRRSSAQFWIEHPAIYFEGLLRNQFKIKDGSNLEWAAARSTVYSGTLRMRVLDLDKWKSSWSRARLEYDTDAFDNLLLADHQKAAGFLNEAVVSCALAVERTKYALWEKLLKRNIATKAQERAARNDTQKPERYFGELLPNEVGGVRPTKAQLESIAKIWVARGLIAHGKETKMKQALGEKLESDLLKKWIDDLWDVAGKAYSF